MIVKSLPNKKKNFEFSGTPSTSTIRRPCSPEVSESVVRINISYQLISNDLISDSYTAFSEFVSTSILANIVCIYLLIILKYTWRLSTSSYLVI